MNKIYLTNKFRLIKPEIDFNYYSEREKRSIDSLNRLNAFAIHYGIALENKRKIISKAVEDE
jgi:hypothetical protein